MNKTDICIAILSEYFFFDGNPVQVVIGISALDDEHLDIIQKISITCSSIDNVEKLLNVKTREEVIDIF
ncbi:MAG: PTS sugar transporter subunit IIA [Mycoplasmatales bacterium]